MPSSGFFSHFANKMGRVAERKDPPLLVPISWAKCRDLVQRAAFPTFAPSHLAQESANIHNFVLFYYLFVKTLFFFCTNECQFNEDVHVVPNRCQTGFLWLI